MALGSNQDVQHVPRPTSVGKTGALEMMHRLSKHRKTRESTQRVIGAPIRVRAPRGDRVRKLVVSTSFLFLVVRHLLLEAMHLFLVAYCFY